MSLEAERFGEFFKAVYGYPPFVWQDYAKREPIKLPEPTPYAPPAPAPASA